MVAEGIVRMPDSSSQINQDCKLIHAIRICFWVGGGGLAEGALIDKHCCEIFQTQQVFLDILCQTQIL